MEKKLPIEVQLGLAAALDADPALDSWAREHESLVVDVAGQLAEHTRSLRLSDREYAVQLSRRLQIVRSTSERHGDDAARKALGL